MSEQIESQGEDPANAQPALYEAEFAPHRSLSAKGFSILVWAMAGIGFVQGVAFILIGAWPVVGFAGVEWLLFWFLFRRHFRGDLRAERILLHRDRLTVLARDARGQVSRSDWQPYWLKVVLEEREPMSNALFLSSHGRRLEIGRFLGPDQRRQLAKTLRAELRRAAGAA